MNSTISMFSAVLAGCVGLGPAVAGGPAPCLPHDLDASGFVDGADLGALLDVWGEAGGHGPADFDGSGAVDGGDLGELLGRWGAVPAGACLSITGISPGTGAQGDAVMLTGVFPDSDAKNYALSAVTSDGTVIPFVVTEVTPNTMSATVGPVPAGAGEAKLVLGHGQGVLTNDSLGEGFTFSGNMWFWTSSEPPLQSTVTFTPTSGAVPGAPLAHQFFGSIVEGVLETHMTLDCAADTEFRIWYWSRDDLAASGAPQQACGYVPSATLSQELAPVGCGEAFCSVLNALSNVSTPPVTSGCFVSPQEAGFLLGYYMDDIDQTTTGAFVIEAQPGQSGS